MTWTPCPICNGSYCPGPHAHYLTGDKKGWVKPKCVECVKEPKEEGSDLCVACLERADAAGEVAETWKDRRDPTGRLQGERVVFREWVVNEGLELVSTNNGIPWTCDMKAGGRHPGSPLVDVNDSGLHAFYDVPDGSRYARLNHPVVGAIVVSGRVLLGPTGVRAEKARIVMLAYGNERQRVLAEGAARKLGVGCCKLEDLERLSLEYGQPVPDEEKPEAEGPASGGVAGGATGVSMRLGGMTRHIAIRNNSLGGTSAQGVARAVEVLRQGLENLKQAAFHAIESSYQLSIRGCEDLVLNGNLFDIKSWWPAKWNRRGILDVEGSKRVLITGNSFLVRHTLPHGRALAVVVGVGVFGFLVGLCVGVAAIGAIL